MSLLPQQVSQRIINGVNGGQGAYAERSGWFAPFVCVCRVQLQFDVQSTYLAQVVTHMNG